MMKSPSTPIGKREKLLKEMKYAPIKIVTANVINPMDKAWRDNFGFSGKVPLPPLKGVFLVMKSNPLLKSKYSFRAFTLVCAQIAPIRARTE
jgi:hypothetical protein